MWTTRQANVCSRKPGLKRKGFWGSMWGSKGRAKTWSCLASCLVMLFNFVIWYLLFQISKSHKYIQFICLSKLIFFPFKERFLFYLIFVITIENDTLIVTSTYTHTHLSTKPSLYSLTNSCLSLIFNSLRNLIIKEKVCT